MQRQETFPAIQTISLENSFMTLKTANVELEVTVGIHDGDALQGNDGYHQGWFELYDVETGGEEWYAEGGLWFKGKELTDYDGVFDLPPAIKNKLMEWGYQVD